MARPKRGETLLEARASDFDLRGTEEGMTHPPRARPIGGRGAERGYERARQLRELTERHVPLRYARALVSGEGGSEDLLRGCVRALLAASCRTGELLDRCASEGWARELVERAIRDAQPVQPVYTVDDAIEQAILTLIDEHGGYWQEHARTVWASVKPLFPLGIPVPGQSWLGIRLTRLRPRLATHGVYFQRHALVGHRTRVYTFTSARYVEKDNHHYRSLPSAG